MDMAQHRKTRFRVFGALALVVVALVLWFFLRPKTDKKPAPVAISVTAQKATQQDLNMTLTALGAAQAWASDTILAQVSGKLIKVNFTEGSEVHAGQVLAVVDPAPYRAALQVQEGTLHKDEATLAKDTRDLTRYTTLLTANAIARQTKEDQEGLVAQDRAVVETDKGNVATARINLSWTNIVSPISGRAGVRLVDVGNLVSSSGSTSSVQSTASATSSASATTSSGSGIVIINQLHPIAVTFTVSEGAFEQLNQQTHGFKTPLQVQATSQETNKPLDTGTLTIADNKVDPATGSVELKANFSNTGNTLWPGQFVNVKLGTQTLPHVTVIPSTAISRGPNGKYVFVIGSDNKAIMRPVVVEGTEGTLSAIKSGINPGDMVVLDGQMSLKAGSLVRVAPPAPDAAASNGAGA